MRTIGVALVVVLAACDAGAPSCKHAVANAVKNGTPVSAIEQATITSVCESNQWSGDVRGCLGRARSSEDATTCMKPVLADLMVANAEAAANATAKLANEHLDDLRDQSVGAGRDVDAAVDVVVGLTTDAGRAEAQAALSVARAKKADLEMKISAARAAAAARTQGVHVSKECLDNPLAAGC